MKYAVGDIIVTKYIYFISTMAVGVITEIYDPQIITGLYRVIIAGQGNKDYWLTDSDIDHKIDP